MLINYLFAQPETVVDGEGVNCHRQMLRVDLGELLTPYTKYIKINEETIRQQTNHA